MVGIRKLIRIFMDSWIRRYSGFIRFFSGLSGLQDYQDNQDNQDIQGVQDIRDIIRTLSGRFQDILRLHFVSMSVLLE